MKLAVTLVIVSFQSLDKDNLCSGQEPASIGQRPASIDGLEAKRSALERQLELIGPDNGDSGPTRKVKEQLLSDIGGIETAEDAIQPTRTKSLFESSTGVEIPVLYVTDREDSNSAGFTTNQRPNGMEYGIAPVIVHTTNGFRPDLVFGSKLVSKNAAEGMDKLTKISNASQFFELISTRALQKDKIKKGTKRVVLFVHGYNVSFDDSMKATARIATQLQLAIVPIAYSWPSTATYSGYFHDEDAVRISEERFTDFLAILLGQPSLDVVIICHSMGARLVTQALYQLHKRQVRLPALHHVVFAAADISVTDFHEHWPGIQSTNTQFSFYCSTNDRALYLSHFAHGFQRLGDASPTVFAERGGQTIDASSVKPISLFGHSYVIDNPIIDADIGGWIDTDSPPTKRGLVKADPAESEYYLFP